MLPVRWILEDALWAHWAGNANKAHRLIRKVIHKVVKETENG